MPVIGSDSNRSGMEAYLQRLAHLDEGLYHDFYGLWIALMVINSLIFMVGLVLNILALYVFCFRTKQKTTSVIYTINLAVTDLLWGACLTCSYLHIFSYFVNMYCSILFLTCICVDRYLAIVQHPGCCLSKLLFLTITEFFLPLIIIMVFTVRIMWALADRRLMQQSRDRRRRAVQLLSTVLIIFTVVVYFHPEMPHHVIAYHLTVTLSSLNSCMDPVVYCFVTNNFQATMRNIFRRAEPEQTSGDIISMQHSSKASGGTANAITNNMIKMTKIPPTLQRQSGE
ncbi:hypothetical protein F7725_018519 [Dissostichus mawsoni]|uniref:G-protein coupled receptors family 1 profile domain-containing protein n=1 Tax=Dissostichus mawsoni TaxID=36200 RepID=A0A7J5XRT1_DISMA|nr:hypothetical protein F7725_018519 [Dissostichus mawsoni]